MHNTLRKVLLPHYAEMTLGAHYLRGCHFLRKNTYFC